MTEPEDKSAAPPQPAGQAVSAANAKSAMKEALRLVKKMGIGAASLLKRLKKDRSPQAMLNTLEESVGTNRQQREEASARVERLFREIAEKKKAFAAAPKARQRILEKELRSRLAEYKAAERQLDVYLENERVLSTVKGRLGEIMAYGMRGISEIAIDDITDEIEDKVAEAEAVADATRDLEKAGRRRERESDKEDLWAELGEFDGEAAASSLDKELAGFDAEETPKRKEPKTPAEPEKESTD
ncbi:MAG: hypothetical protein JXR37_15370 [Kiritimatiellae bacterium]|nr:hypothetical protein [Kiritimatiellia bacterium]